MYGTYESTQYLEIKNRYDEYDEVEFQLTMTCTAMGDPGSYCGDGAYPPEAPEFELSTIHYVDSDGKQLEINYDAFVTMLGSDDAQKLIDKAYDDAIESGDFG